MALSLIAVITGVVYATLMANYVIPNNAFITTAPGITVYDQNDVQVSAINWGDVQRGTEKTFDIKVRNTDGTVTLYLTNSSLTHTMPASFGTLTWNFALKYGGSYQPYAMAPGGGTGPGDGLITLRLAASLTAPATPLNFTITINAYSSPTG
jgi:hypothetical protein